MDFLDEIIAGAKDALKPRNLVMVVLILGAVGLYIGSDLPGSRQLRDALPLG